MPMYNFHKQVSSLLLVLIFITSCNGQSKTQSQIESIIGTKKVPLGQPKIVKTHGTTDNDNLLCNLQDNAGNLWFATSGEGVYCYDGKLFTNYTTADGLSNNNGNCILQAKDGIIWFGTKNIGLIRYDGKTFTNFSE